jgi:hypothetical protein
MTREETIQMAVLAALGCTTIDYRSASRLDKAAGQIARFVEHALTEADIERSRAMSEASVRA